MTLDAVVKYNMSGTMLAAITHSCAALYQEIVKSGTTGSDSTHKHGLITCSYIMYIVLTANGKSVHA